MQKCINYLLIALQWRVILKKDFKNLMEYNDGKRLQTFDEVTTYSYTRSVGCEILMIFKKKNHQT